MPEASIASIQGSSSTLLPIVQAPSIQIGGPDGGRPLSEEERRALADPFKLVHVVSAATEAERNILQWRASNSWPHVRPNSVMIAAIGNHWAPGSWHRVADMVMYSAAQGICVWFYEMQDRCFEPFDAIGTMRVEAAVDAMNAGMEYICYLDTDVLPEPDALIKLLKWGMPIAAPFIAEPGSGKKLHGPGREPNTGLQPVRWCVLSMLLFKTSVFNCTGPQFWREPMGADEGIHFKLLWHYGHHPWIDTNTQVPVYNKPHYPLATNRMSYEERRKYWQEKLQRLQLPPDRRPLDAYSPYIVEGEYMPFNFKEWKLGTPPMPVVAAKVPGPHALDGARQGGTEAMKLVYRA